MFNISHQSQGGPCPRGGLLTNVGALHSPAKDLVMLQSQTLRAETTHANLFYRIHTQFQVARPWVIINEPCSYLSSGSVNQIIIKSSICLRSRCWYLLFASPRVRWWVRASAWTQADHFGGVVCAANAQTLN